MYRYIQTNNGTNQTMHTDKTVDRFYVLVLALRVLFFFIFCFISFYSHNDKSISFFPYNLIYIDRIDIIFIANLAFL